MCVCVSASYRDHIIIITFTQLNLLLLQLTHTYSHTKWAWYNRKKKEMKSNMYNYDLTWEYILLLLCSFVHAKIIHSLANFATAHTIIIAIKMKHWTLKTLAIKMRHKIVKWVCVCVRPNRKPGRNKSIHIILLLFSQMDVHQCNFPVNFMGG